MKLYFQRSNGERRLIGEPQTAQQCHLLINQFLDDHKYKSYYTRIWTEKNGETWFDVGSHTEFFIATDTDMNKFSRDTPRE